MTRADTTWLVGQISSVPVLAGKAFVTLTPYLQSGQPTYPTPYALVHPSDGIDEQPRLSGPSVGRNYEATIHLVGVTADQVQLLADLLRAVLFPDGFGVVPTVTGRICRRVFWRSPLPVQTDTSVTPPLVYYVVEVGWYSEPSS